MPAWSCLANSSSEKASSRAGSAGAAVVAGRTWSGETCGCLGSIFAAENSSRRSRWDLASGNFCRWGSWCMPTIEVVEVILIWIWDIVEIVNLFDGGRLYLGWLWRGGSLFLYLVNRKADIAGRRRHVERVGVLCTDGVVLAEEGGVDGV